MHVNHAARLRSPAGVSQRAVRFVAALCLGLLLSACSSAASRPADITPSTVPARPEAKLGPYFIQVKYLGQRQTDPDGIPMVAYGGVLEYNPGVVAGEGLGYYSDWTVTGNATSRSRFIRDADWLVSRQAADGRWLYEFAWGGQRSPWWSAMAQGQALSLLSRAYQETGDARYKAAAALAREPFAKTQDQGGVTAVDGGYTWFEEYLPPRPPHTLNGFMFTLVGLYEHSRALGDATSGRLFETGLATLRHELGRFDTGDWTCYSLVTPKPASAVPTPTPAPGFGPGGCKLATVMYQDIHVKQLRTLAAWTGDATLGAYADRFARYLQKPPPGVSSATPGP